MICDLVIFIGFNVSEHSDQYEYSHEFVIAPFDDSYGFASSENSNDGQMLESANAIMYCGNATLGSLLRQSVSRESFPDLVDLESGSGVNTSASNSERVGAINSNTVGAAFNDNVEKPIRLRTDYHSWALGNKTGLQTEKWYREHLAFSRERKLLVFVIRNLFFVSGRVFCLLDLQVTFQ